MSYRLPDGSIVTFGSVLAAAVTISGISNANPAVATSTAHGLANGTLIVLTSGWQRLTSRVFRVAATAANTFALEGVDTTDTTAFSPGGGAGSAQAVTTMVELPQILTLSASGGDQQFATFSFLADNFERQLPTTFSAMTLQMTMADDVAQPGYIAALAASRARAIRPIKFALPDGSSVLFNGYISVNEVPTFDKGQIMQTKMSLTLTNLPVRYAT